MVLCCSQPPPPVLSSVYQKYELYLRDIINITLSLDNGWITLQCYSSHHTGQRMTHCAHSAPRDNLFLANMNS